MLVHANGCLTAIDNSRHAVYGFDQRVEVFGATGMASSENPLAHTGGVMTGAGHARAALPYFFLERYILSYVREWQAFIAARAARARPTPMSLQDARAPLVIGMAAWRSLREGGPVRLNGSILGSLSRVRSVRVYLAGASGFVGSNLFRVLAGHGAEVTAPEPQARQAHRRRRGDP